MNRSGSMSRTRTAREISSVHWYIWFGALTITFCLIAGAWDVAWHHPSDLNLLDAAAPHDSGWRRDGNNGADGEPPF
jgi:hypothetical protein